MTALFAGLLVALSVFAVALGVDVIWDQRDATIQMAVLFAEDGPRAARIRAYVLAASPERYEGIKRHLSMACRDPLHKVVAQACEDRDGIGTVVAP